jgi:hypothetical protein
MIVINNLHHLIEIVDDPLKPTIIYPNVEGKNTLKRQIFFINSNLSNTCIFFFLVRHVGNCTFFCLQVDSLEVTECEILAKLLVIFHFIPSLYDITSDQVNKYLLQNNLLLIIKPIIKLHF